MTHLIHRAVSLAAALTAVAFVALSAAPAAAQCSSCATPTVAYYPQAVVAAPAFATYYRPGLFDRWRMRRWDVAPVAVAPAYATSYAPYTAGYAEYSASYAPYAASYTPYAASYTPYAASYAPYVTAYAPLQSAVVQTSYLPPAISACSSCGQTSCGCATAVLRPVMPACTTCNYGCSSCAVEAPCSSCAAAPCSTCASYPAEAPCSSCAASVGQAVYAQPSGGCSTCGTSMGDPVTPPPQMAPQEPAPGPLEYPGTPVAPASGAMPDPAPAAEDASTYLAPPQLLGPTNDRTANRPTVDVWNAVYHRPAASSKVSTAVQKPAPRLRTQAEIDAEGWQSVPVR